MAQSLERLALVVVVGFATGVTVMAVAILAMIAGNLEAALAIWNGFLIVAASFAGAVILLLLATLSWLARAGVERLLYRWADLHGIDLDTRDELTG